MKRDWRRELRNAISRNDHRNRSEEHTSELQSQSNLVCRLLLEKKKKNSRNGLVGNHTDIKILAWADPGEYVAVTCRAAGSVHTAGAQHSAYCSTDTSIFAL